MTSETKVSKRFSLQGWYSNLARDERSVVISYSMIILIIFTGAIFITPNFASPNFLTQQLRLASFLGIIAAGQMVVVLTGNIDLSIPWTLNLAAVVATSIAAGQNENLAFGVGAAIAIGLIVGLVNGVGVAYLRIPSMVLTL